mmetsp:Transcript_3820/g.15511  ORF Transcript_3820/g.15511 Transcript_3820/m.15511 type:complete len:458 (-) Transcript_3820:147-1520(-)
MSVERRRFSERHRGRRRRRASRAARRPPHARVPQRVSRDGDFHLHRPHLFPHPVRDVSQFGQRSRVAHLVPFARHLPLGALQTLADPRQLVRQRADPLVPLVVRPPRRLQRRLGRLVLLRPRLHLGVEVRFASLNLVHHLLTLAPHAVQRRSNVRELDRHRIMRLAARVKVRSPVLRVRRLGDGFEFGRDSLELDSPFSRVNRRFDRPALLDLLLRLAQHLLQGRVQRGVAIQRGGDRVFLLLVVVVVVFIVRTIRIAVALAAADERGGGIARGEVAHDGTLGTLVGTPAPWVHRARQPVLVVSSHRQIAEAVQDPDALAAVAVPKLPRRERGRGEAARLELGEDRRARGVGIVELVGGPEPASAQRQQVRAERGEVVEELVGVLPRGEDGEVRPRARRPRGPSRRQKVALVSEHLELLEAKLHAHLGLHRELHGELPVVSHDDDAPAFVAPLPGRR